MNKDLTVGKPETVLWKFCLPLFGSIVFQQLYNIADSLVAGKFIGENALAAVGKHPPAELHFRRKYPDPERHQQLRHLRNGRLLRRGEAE